MSFFIVSDLDDTLKISETSDKLQTVYRGLFKKEAFTAMNILFQEWIPSKDKFLLISSSPRSIHSKIHRFLKKHEFPNHEIWLRDWIKQPKIKEYKLGNLARLKETFAGPYILLGDDQEYDPEVFTEFKEKNPDLVLKIYIRRLRDRKLPKECTGFVTPLDIALEEYNEKRLKIPQLSRIAKALLEEQTSDFIIPPFSKIKKINEKGEYPITIESLILKVNQKLNEILEQRVKKSSKKSKITDKKS